MNTDYIVIFNIKNEDRIDELTKQLMIDQYVNVYNNMYCMIANEEYYKIVNDRWMNAHPNGYDQDDYMEYIRKCNMIICDMINKLYDPLMTYKMDEIDVSFVGVLKDDPEVEISVFLKKQPLS